MAKANPLTEPLEPYEPTTTLDSTGDYDWEYADERSESAPINILWGRVAVLGGAIVLAFLIGRMTGGGGGVPAAELEAARDRVATLEQDNQTLNDRLAATEQELTDARSQLAAAPVEAPEAAPADPAAEGDQSNEIKGETYVVEPGDTLTTLAERFYGDASLDDYLAEVNNISDPTALSVGQELIIPDDPPDA